MSEKTTKPRTKKHTSPLPRSSPNLEVESLEVDTRNTLPLPPKDEESTYPAETRKSIKSRMNGKS
jgi:hypothetical protein